MDKVKPDNVCDFGKWLHGLPPNDKVSNHWKTIQKLHAELHQTAAGVLGNALGGKKSEAEKGVAMGSAFANVSGQLTTAMMN